MQPIMRGLAITIGAALAGFMLPPVSVQAASFDCSKAARPDEVAVCANRDLNDDDVEMATRYSMLLQLLPMGSAGDLRDGQKAWLAWRKACGADLPCLRNAYQVRISALKAGFQRIASRGPF